MGYAERHKFPPGWPVPPVHQDSNIAMRSYQEGLAECELAERAGFDWVSLSSTITLATAQPLIRR